MLTTRFPTFFEPRHAAVEREAQAFRAAGPIRDRVAALGRAGLLRLTERGPEARGIALVRFGLARNDALTDLALIIQELGSWPLAQVPGFEAEVEDARAGRAVTVFALTEPEAGSDVRNVQTRAEPDGSGWRLTGLKHFISNAPEADRATVFARVGDSVGCFLVDRPPAEAQAVAGHSIGRLRFDRTPARLVAMRGLPLALGTLERCRPTVGAAALGMARRAIDETVRHVRARQQFGAPLADLPVVRLRVAEMALEWETAILATLHACWRRDTAGPSERTGYESAVGKIAATEAAQRIVDGAVQLHGALGVEEDYVVQQLYRDIRPLRIYEGATDVLLTLIATRWLEEGWPTDV
jgi:acyl-CoA dehydrogenase